MTSSKIALMMAVYVVWLFRRVAKPLTVHLSFMLVGLWYLGAYYVSYRDVLTNTSTAPSLWLQASYLFGAYTHTELTAQIVIGICTFLLVWLGWNISKQLWQNNTKQLFLAL